MARRKYQRKTKKRRTTKSGINVINVAETALLLNAVTKGFAGLPLNEFIMGDNNPGSFNLTLKEIIGGLTGLGTDGIYAPSATRAGIEASISGVMGRNLKKNWASMAGQMILIPASFRIGKKLARPALTRTRKLLKDAGLKGTVTV
jgi:hypothetical protein